MTIGLAFFSWDSKSGAVLDMKYPETLDVSDALLNKIYMTHAYEEQYNADELIEINYNNQIVLSYCDKSRVSKVGYEVLILIMHEKENIFSYNFKLKLVDLAKQIIQRSNEDRKTYFLDNIDSF